MATLQGSESARKADPIGVHPQLSIFRGDGGPPGDRPPGDDSPDLGKLRDYFAKLTVAVMSLPGLSSTAKLIYAAHQAASFRDGTHTLCNATIGDICGKPEGTVRRVNIDLERAGLIRRQEFRDRETSSHRRVQVFNGPPSVRLDPSEEVSANRESERRENPTLNVGGSSMHESGEEKPDRSELPADEPGPEATATAPPAFDLRMETGRKMIEILEVRKNLARVKLDDRGKPVLVPVAGVKLEDVWNERVQEAFAEYEPEIVAILRERQAGPPASSPGGPGAARRCGPPAVSPEDQREIRAMIGRLRLPNQGAELCDKLAHRMTEVFRDADPEVSRTTYRGLAEDCRDGVAGRPTALLIDAFEYACKNGIKKPRGSAFIWYVQTNIKNYTCK